MRTTASSAPSTEKRDTRCPAFTECRDPRQPNHLKAFYTLTRSLDATRLVIDNEGWEHTDMTDLFAIHDYARTGEMIHAKYQNRGAPGAGVPDKARAALMPGYR